MRCGILATALLLTILPTPLAAADECVALSGERSGSTVLCIGERDEPPCADGRPNGWTGAWSSHEGPLVDGPLFWLGNLFIGGFRGCSDDGSMWHGIDLIAGVYWHYVEWGDQTSCRMLVVMEPCVPPPEIPWGQLLP